MKATTPLRRAAVRAMALVLCVLLGAPLAAYAKGSTKSGGYVHGYTRKDGTYVEGYYRGGSSTGASSTTGSIALPADTYRPAPTYGAHEPGKTVHVRSYRRKDGTYVHSYWRHPPGLGTGATTSGTSSANTFIATPQNEVDDDGNSYLVTPPVALTPGVSYVAGFQMPAPAPTVGAHIAGSTLNSAASPANALPDIVISFGKEDAQDGGLEQAAPQEDEQDVLVHFGQTLRLYKASSHREPKDDEHNATTIADVSIPAADFIQMCREDHVLFVTGDVHASVLLTGEKLNPLKLLAAQLSQTGQNAVTLQVPAAPTNALPLPAAPAAPVYVAPLPGAPPPAQPLYRAPVPVK